MIISNPQFSLRHGVLWSTDGARMGRLVVGDQDQLGTVKGGPDLELSRVSYYFGGVDPEFDRKK